ncbi:carbohydrate-binding protein [Pelagicoccus sp. SDUM812005]|uniref:carbohydrate-binding protein n=1 Tax=Pelagicoccus sp. SDUM812005 TaxID=3041257 RepID=UPI00280DD4E2|nr:carbohydrate-binding protein [Pelagicoccus sp. SDUM812005]MDQ8183292.1 carbohydrate-binding protein [Pelagicoccus sp. SDUM812005]
MQLTGYDALEGSDYESALTEDVTQFTPATLNLYAYVGDTRYRCVSGVVQDNTGRMYVRLIESGQYVQRFDHLGLVFEDANGNVLVGNPRLEVTAWADHVTFKLDLEEVPGATRATIQVVSPSNVQHLADALGNVARLSLSPHTDTAYEQMEVGDYLSDALDLGSGSPLDSEYDTDEMAIKAIVPAGSVSYPRDTNRLDEYQFTVRNPTDEEIEVPMIFDPISARAVTGTVMLLTEVDGSPLGIPVQISKNWHQSLDTVHMGTWLRGYTMLPLAPGESKTFRLRVVYGYWSDGTVAAASHSFLSIVGWNDKANWKWDESALGAWGESLTYDPTRHAGRAHMADVRPTFTTSTGGGDHGWTENMGGGNFLQYYDSSNTFRFSKLMKTCYKWSGPNVTEVLYSGISDDGKIRYVNTVRGVAGLDYHRKFNAFRYEFLDDVTDPRRLIFFQMGADGYNGPQHTAYHHGSAEGLTQSYASSPGGNQYKGDPLLFRDSWVIPNDTTAWNGGVNYAYRGFLALSSTLNGEPFDLYMHPYGLSASTPKMLFDLSSESVGRSYAAGDVVEGEMEFMMPPKNAESYWGADEEFRSRLAAYTSEWGAVYDEFRYNRDLEVVATTGSVLSNYPLEISSESGDVLADFTIDGGGIGHVPVILRNVSKEAVIGVQRYLDGEWVWYEDGSFNKRNYFQGFYNAEGSLDCAFSFKRPSEDLSESWRIRILGNAVYDGGGEGALESEIEGEDYTSTSGCLLRTDSPGYSGAGYMDMGGAGTWLQWEGVGGGAGGEVKLTFRYASATDRSCTITVNGIAIGSHVFSSTGTWDNWQEKTIVVALLAGENTIRITVNTDAGGPNVDRISLAANRLSAGEQFQVWAQAKGLSGSDLELSADPDRDGVVNLVEYALGGNPLSGEDRGMFPLLQRKEEGLEFVYQRRRDAEDRGIVYSIMDTRPVDFLNWKEGAVTEIARETVDADYERVRATTPDDDAFFMKLKIALQD